MAEIPNNIHPSSASVFRRALLLVATAVLVASACSSTPTVDESSTVNAFADTAELDSPDAEAPTTEPEPESEPEPTEPPPTPEPETSLEDVAAATVKIAADGSFVPPGEDQRLSADWSGTGFIINDEGYTVTNNHVVTGAALLKVYVPGNDDPVNARVLGVSECSDLAVIDLDGDGYAHIGFRDDPITPGLAVYSAGYPQLGDDSVQERDYTLTGGIVSNTTGSGETYHASVETVIEHDAKIRGGNSGGPLVDEQGQVVGVNYFGGDLDDFNLAIEAQKARDIIDALQNGSVESIGINGQAVAGDEVTGVWVSGVESGSPADISGLEAGDVILTMEGLELGRDGTMSDYCDIIRSHSPTDTLNIEVLRIGTQEILEGQINGEPLAQAFSFAQELADDVGTTTGSGGGESYTEYMLVSDDSEDVIVEVPVEWSDLDGVLNEDFGPSIWASPNLAGFNESWEVPGIIVEVNRDAGPADQDAVLDLWSELDCTSGGREDFETADGYFSGRWEFFNDCGGTDTGMLILAASPPDGSLVVRMLVQIVEPRDIEAADWAIGSFDVIVP